MALSPMMQHYLNTKQAYPDCILFYRLGDFYEMFFEDAETVSKELELTLTGKSCGLPERAPMCGVPFHAADMYIGRLIERGFKVAICEQVEDPATAKGMVKREVVRVVTPGTQLAGEELDEAKNNYLMSVVWLDDVFGVSIADISTGRCLVTELGTRSALFDEILKFTPSEIICNQAFFVSGIDIESIRRDQQILISARPDADYTRERCEQILCEHFGAASLQALGLDDVPCGMTAAGALFAYLYETQKSDMRQMTKITPYDADHFMVLDSATRRNLELTETLRDKQKRGSLLWVLDHTRTAMGARLLRSWIEQPLIDAEAIKDRLAAVSALAGAPMRLDELREYLKPIYDMERLASRIVCKSANPRDLIAFRNSLRMLPLVRGVLGELGGELHASLLRDLDPLEDLCALIEASIEEEPPVAMKEGGIIRTGYNEQVDNYRAAGENGKAWLSELEAREREETGIRNLRIRFNKVFGYCIEVTNSFRDKVPDRYVRRQTLTNAERYTTDELKEMEETILGAQERLSDLEYEIFSDIRAQIAGEIARIQRTAAAVATADVIAGFAHVASRESYVCPEIRTDGVIDIRDGRHPVVERMTKDQMFIPNDTKLDQDDDRVAVITGPNMAGKSTYMRQCALIVLMAQIGSFVPAGSAEIGIVDRIFTRVGASDDLASGQSTFMVEMSEVANILRNATKRSLLVLDEIGRGTSTFDGLAIAWAVVEYVARLDRIGAKTLFATHYHELTELEDRLPGVKNYCIAVKEHGNEILFLRKIIRGGADRSYGIQVARLAGVPEEVLARAEVFAKRLAEEDVALRLRAEMTGDEGKTAADGTAGPDGQGELAPNAQFSLFPEENTEVKHRSRKQTAPAKDADGTLAKVADEIRRADLSHMTPIEALNLLDRLQREVL